jgi:hypothetical protein
LRDPHAKRGLLGIEIAKTSLPEHIRAVDPEHAAGVQPKRERICVVRCPPQIGLRSDRV